MTDLPSLLELARTHGFEHAGEMQTKALKFLPEVRDMCAADRCRCFGKNWTCPPLCGSLEQSVSRVADFSWGVLVQTVGRLEDDFDYEAMEAAALVHQGRFHAFVDDVRRESPRLLAMGAGPCTLCPECTCPEAPCRFPDQAITSMEAFGLFVSQVCESNHLDYNRGPLTVTYTSCVLLTPSS